MTIEAYKGSVCVCVCVRARVRAVVSDPWMVAYQAPQSMECSRQEYWSGLPFPTPGDLPNLGGSNLHLLCLLHGQADFFFFNQCITWKALIRDLPSPLSLVLTKNSEPFLLSRVTGRDWPSCSMTVTPGTSLKTKYII